MREVDPKAAPFATRRTLFAQAGALAMAAALPRHARAQSAWPSQPVKLIAAYPPGGVADLWARIVATPMQAGLGQPVLVVNRPGASGTIGFSSVAKSPPDGYTLVIGSAGPLASGPAVQKITAYDAKKDFTAVGMIGEYELILMSSATFPARNVNEMVQYARANPGALRFAIGSPGAIMHLLAARFVAANGLQVNWIPYKGTAQAVTDLLAGVVDVLLDGLPVALPQVKAGKLKALAVSSGKRTVNLPEVPTFAEAGYPGYIASNWISLNAPAGTPRDVLLRLNAELNKALTDPRVQEAFALQSAHTVPMGVDETQRYIDSEYERWGRIAADTGVKILD